MYNTILALHWVNLRHAALERYLQMFVFINLIKLIIIWALEVDLIFVTCAFYNQMGLKWFIQLQLLTINVILSHQHPRRHNAYFLHASLNMEHNLFMQSGLSFLFVL